MSSLSSVPEPIKKIRKKRKSKKIVDTWKKKKPKLMRHSGYLNPVSRKLTEALNN